MIVERHINIVSNIFVTLMVEMGLGHSKLNNLFEFMKLGVLDDSSHEHNYRLVCLIIDGLILLNYSTSRRQM
jgi:hypothetical protein